MTEKTFSQKEYENMIEKINGINNKKYDGNHKFSISTCFENKNIDTIDLVDLKDRIQKIFIDNAIDIKIDKIEPVKKAHNLDIG